MVACGSAHVSLVLFNVIVFNKFCSSALYLPSFISPICWRGPWAVETARLRIGRLVNYWAGLHLHFLIILRFYSKMHLIDLKYVLYIWQLEPWVRIIVVHYLQNSSTMNLFQLKNGQKINFFSLQLFCPVIPSNKKKVISAVRFKTTVSYQRYLISNLSLWK